MVGRYVVLAVRGLRATPAYTAVLLLTLTVGIGVNVLLFSAIESILFRPGVAAPAELVNIYRRYEPRSSARALVSYADYQDIVARRLDAFTGVLAFMQRRQATAIDGRTELATIEIVSPNYFDVLGIRANPGVAFGEAHPDAAARPVLVISEGLWNRRFGRDTAAIGQSIVIGHRSFQVIGVIPEPYRGGGATFIRPTDVWLPMPAAIEAGLVDSRLRSDRQQSALIVRGRLTAADAVPRAQAELRVVAQQLEAAFPTPSGGSIDVTRRFDLRRSADVLVHESVDAVALPAMLAALLTTLLVLAIACTNITNVSLARVARRSDQVAIRVALGATPADILVQCLTESLVVAALGALCAIGLVAAAARIPPYTPISIAGAPIVIAFTVDRSLLAFAAALALVSAIATGLLPAIRATGVDVTGVLAKTSMVGAGAQRFLGTRNVLMMVQVAASVVLLGVAALVVRSYTRVAGIDPGFDDRNAVVLTLERIQPPRADDDVAAAVERLHQRVGQLAGMITIGVTTHLPFDGAAGSLLVEPDAGVPGDTTLLVRYVMVSSGYFSALGLPLVRGRDFSSQDLHAPSSVAIVSEAAATRFWPNRNPIGQRLRVRRADADASHTPAGLEDVEIVGVAAGTFDSRRRDERRPLLYRPFGAAPASHATLVVRSARPSPEVIEMVRQRAEATGDFFVSDVSALSAYVEQQDWQSRAAAAALLAIGLTGLGLAMLGLYGITTYMVSERRREIGVRVAVGATRWQVVSAIVREAMAVVVAGTAIGLTLAVLVIRLVTRMFVGIPALSLPVLLAVPALLLATSLVACLLPARAAARLDPLAALRSL